MCHKQYLNAWNLPWKVINSIKYATDYVLPHKPAKLRKYASNTNKQHRNKFNSTSRIDNKIVKIVKKKLPQNGSTTSTPAKKFQDETLDLKIPDYIPDLSFYSFFVLWRFVNKLHSPVSTRRRLMLDLETKLKKERKHQFGILSVWNLSYID